MKQIPNNFYAILRNSFWVVRDSNGGTWIPNESTKLEIMNAKCAPEKAIEICYHEPIRGKWIS